MRHECFFCFTKAAEGLIKKFDPPQEDAQNFVYDVIDLLHESRNNLSPVAATQFHRDAKRYLGSNDLYAAEKRYANELLLGQYNHYKEMVNGSKDPFHMAAKLAVAANIIDYGAHTVPDDIEAHLNEIVSSPFAIDLSNELREKIELADSILYLGDNAGEIVFDKLLLETIDHPNVTFAVRGEPVLNDITLEDARKVGVDELCRVISNGFDAPSTILSECSDEFMEVYNSVDLIISKGQGNFEGLMNEKNSKIFFMLMAKCDPIAEKIGVVEGDLVITQTV